MKRLTSGARACVLLAAMTALAAPAAAQSVDSVINAENTRLQRQVQSQTRIDRIVSQTRSITDEFRAVNKEIDGLNIYNQLLEAQVARQQQKLDEIESSMSRATMINRQVLPLITRMTAALKQSVNVDIPFLMAERTERIDRIRSYLTNANISAAERFRQVLNAYAIENDYGKFVEVYRDTVTTPDGELNVNMLQVGRAGLYYQTLDGTTSGYWDNNERSWKSLDSSYDDKIAQAIRIAQDKVEPDLMELPIAAPEVRS